MWHPSMTEWAPARDIPGLFPREVAPAEVAPATEPEAAPQPAPKRKTGLVIAAAAVAAVLLVSGLGFGAWKLLGGPGGAGPGSMSGPDVGAASHIVPDPTDLVETERWGEVPANQVGLLMHESAGRKDAEKVAEALGGSVIGEVEFAGVYQVGFPGTSEADLTAAIDAATAHDAVEGAFPNADAGELSAPSAGPNGQPYPYGSHGTGASTIIAADPDNGGPAGIAGPLGDNLTISMTNIFSSQYGYSQSTPDPDDPTKMVWSDGTTYAIGNLVALRDQISSGATIINCSWGATDTDEITVAAYQRFFRRMAEEHPGVLFVCSAGNNGRSLDGSRRFPSGMPLPNIITVGALDNDGATAEYSNMASANYEVTLAAPGTQAIVGLKPDGGVFRANGTSFSAPKVAAAAAVLRSIDPDLSAGQIKDILVATARDGVATRSTEPDATSKLIGQEVGGRILALDRAVFKVINDSRAKRGLEPLTEEELEGMGAIDAVAIIEGDPTEMTVRGIVKGVGEKGTGVKIDVWSTNSAISGSTTQRLGGPGETSGE